MLKYSLRLTKDSSHVDPEFKPVELKELDALTRKYYGRKELIGGLTVKRQIPLGLDGSWNVKIMKGIKNKKTSKLTPIYKEKYVSKKGDPIYDQIFSFATKIGAIFEKYAKKENNHYIIPSNSREDVAYELRKIEGLRYPEFYNFTREYFINNIYISKNNYSDTNDGVYNTRIKLDFSGITVYNNFYNKKDAIQVNKEIAIDFYNDLLYGFHKIFYKSDKPFDQDYSGIREYYKAYYYKFIAPQIKDQKDEFFEDAVQLTFDDIMSAKKEPVVEEHVSYVPDYKYVSDDGISHVTMEEAHSLYDEFYPDEFKSNNTFNPTIALNQDGTFVDYDDEEYRHIK